MKCRYTFKLVSETALAGSLHFSHGKCKFTLVADKGRLSAIILEHPGVRFKKFPTITPPVGGRLAAVSIPADPLLPFVQLEMRAVRGALSLWGIFDIEMEHPKSEWIPETEEEQKATDVFGFSQSDTPLGQCPPVDLPLDQIIRPLISRQSFIPLEIPLEFFRRGRVDLYEHRYIEAIYDFYFVLEYLFADGKFTKNGTREAMLASPELCRVIREAQASPMPAINRREEDRRTFDRKYRSKSVEEAVDAILELRGLLHHQSSTRKTNWSPATPEQFKVDAYFLCAASHSAVLNLSCGLVFEPEQDSAFKSTPVFTDTGRRINWTPIPEEPTRS